MTVHGMYTCTNHLETAKDVDYCLAHKCCVGGCKYFVWVKDVRVDDDGEDPAEE